MLGSYIRGTRSVTMFPGGFTFDECFILLLKILKLLSLEVVFEKDMYGTLRLHSLKITWKFFFSYTVNISFFFFFKFFIAGFIHS